MTAAISAGAYPLTQARARLSALGLQRQRGMTLIEAATVLAILAFVVAGIMLLYTNADQSRKTQQALSELAMVQQAVRGIYGGQSSYAGLTTVDLLAIKSLPSSMTGPSRIKNAFNGSVLVSAVDAGGGAGSGFSVVFTNIPNDPCVKIVTADLGRGVHSVTAGTTTLDQNSPLPFTPAQAGAACNAGSSNTISWVFN